MGKYSYNRRAPIPPKPWTIHPIWRGIGCLMMILIPIMSYAGASLLVQANVAQRWVPIPAELARTINVPLLGDVRYLLAILALAVFLSLVGFGVLTAVYSVIYKVLGPPQYGPLDAPPLRQTTARRRR
jgi:hypothetical protein